MCKSDVFNHVMNIVSRETEVDSAEIVGGGRTDEVVEARCIFFAMLREQGFTPAQIASKTHRTAAAVRYLLSKYEDRIAANRMVNLYVKRVRKELANI